MKFRIKNRFSGEVAFECDIECDDNASYSLKLGMAIRLALKSSADLSSADLSSADLRSADLRSANLRSANLSSADLRSANLRSADLSYTDLSSADLRSANLRSANLSSADLRYTDLSSADLSSANLRSADLSSADLRSANLRSADLSYTDLSYTNLSSADLRSANLRSADLRSTNLRSAKNFARERYVDLLMLLDQPGRIRAYKLVKANGEGPFNGGIIYQIGGSYSTKADTDVNVECGAGINVATLPWCLREWQKGYKILIVEFEAADIAAIPSATDGKFRLHRCDVVAEKEIDPIALGLIKTEEERAA